MEPVVICLIGVKIRMVGVGQSLDVQSPTQANFTDCYWPTIQDECLKLLHVSINSSFMAIDF